MKISFRGWSDLSWRNVKSIADADGTKRENYNNFATVANETTGTNGLVSFAFRGGSSLNMQALGSCARKGRRGCFLR